MTAWLLSSDDEEALSAAVRELGLRYVVLQRVPHEGLPARSSTDLRGF